MKAIPVSALRERGWRLDVCRGAEPQGGEPKLKQLHERKTDTVKTGAGEQY